MEVIHSSVINIGGIVETSSRNGSKRSILRRMDEVNMLKETLWEAVKEWEQRGIPSEEKQSVIVMLKKTESKVKSREHEANSTNECSIQGLREHLGGTDRR